MTMKEWGGGGSGGVLAPSLRDENNKNEKYKRKNSLYDFNTHTKPKLYREWKEWLSI